MNCLGAYFFTMKPILETSFVNHCSHFQAIMNTTKLQVHNNLK